MADDQGQAQAGAADGQAQAGGIIQLDAAALQAVVQQAVQAAIAGIQQANPVVAGQQQQQQAPNQNPTFALRPGQGNVNTPWDFASGDGLKLFQAATKPMEPKFDGKNAKLQYFLDAVKSRAKTYGMGSVLNVTVAQGDDRDITYEYGSLTEAQMIAHATTYQTQDNRDRQASAVLITLLENSITPELMDELKQTDYQVSVNVNNVDVKREDGPLMLYRLIGLVAVETRATVSSILKALTGAGLTSIMEEEKSDIKAFNNRVNMLMVALRARKREVPDIIPYLFEAYSSCEDSNFVGYMSMREQFYEDGTTAQLTNVQLMDTALQKYKGLVDKKIWLQKSRQELEFIAMMGKLEAAEKKLVQIKKTPTKAKKQTGTKTGPVNDGDWAWKGVAPKPGEPRSKTFRNKRYIYCDHGATKWVLEEKNGMKHKDTCSKLNSDSSTASTGSSSASDVTPTKKTAWNQALAAVQEDVSMMTEEEENLVETSEG